MCPIKTNLLLALLLAVATALFPGTEAAAGEEFDPYLFLAVRTRQMRLACDADDSIERCHCLYKDGTYETGPFYYDENPLESVVVYVGCNPDYCYCKNNPTEAKDTRPLELRAIIDLCPANQMSRCLCADKEVVKFPFDMSTLFFDCRPTKCKCKSEAQPKKVTGLGCAQGGTPYCPDVKEPTFVCKDGTKFSRNDVLRHQAAGRDECVCADGVMPRCQNTKDLLKCPDGSNFDLDIGSPGPYLSRCKYEEFSF